MKMVYLVALEGVGHETGGLLHIDDVCMDKHTAEMRRGNLEKQLQDTGDQEWSATVKEFPLNEASPSDY